MKYEDLVLLSESNLKKNLLDLKKEHFNLRFQKAMGELTNFSRFKVVKRDIAKIMMLLNKK